MNDLFSLPSTSNNEQLVRTGLMTPFGASATPTLTPPPGPSLADFDWLGKNEEPKGGKGPLKNKRPLKKRTESPVSSSTSTTENESRLLAMKSDTTQTGSCRNENEDRPHSLDSDSSYTTDDELGPPQEKRKREGGESEDEPLLHSSKGGGVSKRKRREGDDGDDSSYRRRIK